MASFLATLGRSCISPKASAGLRASGLKADSCRIIEKINSINLEKNKLYEIILIGKRNFEININEIYKYYLDEKIIKIKNNTKINYNIEKIIQENNLKGLFVKELLNNKNNYNEKIIEKALEIGLEILS